MWGRTSVDVETANNVSKAPEDGVFFTEDACSVDRVFPTEDADSVVDSSLTMARSSGLPCLCCCPTYQWNLEKESNRKKHIDLPSAELVTYFRPSL